MTVTSEGLFNLSVQLMQRSLTSGVLTELEHFGIIDHLVMTKEGKKEKRYDMALPGVRFELMHLSIEDNESTA